MDGGNHPLEDDYAQHDPWSPALFLEKNITTGPAKCGVDAWSSGRVNTYNPDKGSWNEGTVKEGFEPNGG